MPVLSDAPFYAPLKTSLILQNGSGNPTFGRTSNGRVFDNERLFRILPSGAAAFDGARLVRNFFTASGDMYNSSNWAVSNQSKAAASDPAGNSGAVTCTVTANSSNYLRQSYSVSSMPGTDKTFKILYKPGTSQWIRIFFYDGGSNRVSVWFNATTHVIGTVSTGGTGWGYVSSSLIASVSYPGWYELYVVYTSPASGTTFFIQMGDVDADGSINTTTINGKSITWAFPQHENVTGRADKMPSEYVATGVLSLPYYGAGVDGIRYFDTNKDGSPIPESTLKRLKLNSAAVTNTALWCRDFTNAAWVKDGVTPLLNQVGIDGQVNSCSLLTATKDNAKVYQTITAASSSGCAGVFVRRSIGTGRVWFTRDNYTTLLDITDLINSGTFTLCAIENTSVLNPVVGFELETSGDAIIADAGINHLGTEIAGTIFTTSTAVTVNAETLTYQTSGNFSDTAGTIIATVERGNWANNNGVVVGKAGSGLSTSASNSGVQALDGTNTVNGPAGSAATRRKIGMKWSGSTMKTFAGGNFGTAGSYDGSFNLTTIAIMPQSNGYIRDVAVWPTELSDADMLSVASEQSDFSAAVTLAAAAYANVIHSVSAAMPFSFSATAYASVIHSVSAAIGIDFNTAMRANVIHSVSAELGITFSTDFDLTWIIPSLTMAGSYSPLTVVGSYSPPVIQGTYGPTT